jgi:hypothetical protein
VDCSAALTQLTHAGQVVSGHVLLGRKMIDRWDPGVSCCCCYTAAGGFLAPSFVGSGTAAVMRALDGGAALA